VSHELKTKGDKVLALRKLEEGHNQKEKKIEGRPRVERERKGEKRKVCRKSGEKPKFLCKI